MISRTDLAARVALGLVASLLPAPHRIGDTRLFAQARLHLWPPWRDGVIEDRDLIARFLGQRPEALGEDEALLEALRAVFGDADDFEARSGSPADAKWEDEFAVVPGRPVRERLTDWLKGLEGSQPRAARGQVRTKDGHAIELMAADHVFRVPGAHISTPDGQPWVLKTTPPVPQLIFDRAALRELARAIDADGHFGVRYEDIAVDGFLHRLGLPRNRGARRCAFGSYPAHRCADRIRQVRFRPTSSSGHRTARSAHRARGTRRPDGMEGGAAAPRRSESGATRPADHGAQLVAPAREARCRPSRSSTGRGP